MKTTNKNIIFRLSRIGLPCLLAVLINCIYSIAQEVTVSDSIYHDNPLTENKFDFATCDVNRHIFVTTTTDDQSILVLKFDNHRIISVDSICLPGYEQQVVALKVIVGPDKIPKIYWIQQFDAFKHLSLYSMIIENNKTEPELLFRFKDESIYNPKFYFNEELKNLYCIYSKYSDEHFYLRLDNEFVQFSKDFIRSIKDKYVGSIQQIQPNGRYYVENSKYFMAADTVYSLYNIEYDMRSRPGKACLEEYINGRKICSKDGESVTQITADTAPISPLGIINGNGDIIYYWCEADNFVSYAHWEDGCKVSAPRPIGSGHDIFDAVAENNMIAFLLENKIFIFNNEDSLVAKYDIGEKEISDGRIMSLEDGGRSIWIIVKSWESDRTKSLIKIKNLRRN